MEYGTDILNLLESLELQRIEELKKFSIIAVFILIVNILFFIKFRSAFFITLVAGILVLAGSYYLINSSYKSRVENTLIPKLIQKIDSDFSYKRDEKIDLNLINSFKFFSHKIDKEIGSGVFVLNSQGRYLKIWLTKFQSIKIDTEEGEHPTDRFNGAYLVLDMPYSVDQRYLLTKDRYKIDIFEAGDYLNRANMELTLVGTLDGDWSLFSEDGDSNLRDDIFNKLRLFSQGVDRELSAIFSKDKLYIFIDNMDIELNISIFNPIFNSSFVRGYNRLFKEAKELINS